ncbi:receptor-like protein EIX1 [Pyrus communis]|uniref:receptor-like protein EIX1 n=1 Tax=Pyrus communis TaxID=23211 RepID=UPI0035BFB9E4
MRSTSVILVRFLSIIATLLAISLCNGNTGVPCKDNERRALLMFKQELHDSSNRLSSWVGHGEGDCCTWLGVVCGNLTGHVRELHLGNYYLGGKLNPSLLNLSSLNYLDLSNNDFDGILIPNFFGSLTSLRHLDLSQANFQGIIPHQLGNLSSLRYLDLHGNYFEVNNLQWISGLSMLQHLDLSGVNLSKASDSIQETNMASNSLLEYLDMSDCRLRRIPGGIANMASLRVLNLSRNSINSTIPKWLYSLSHLESLFLSDNGLYGEISTSIGNLTAIVNLDVSHNQLWGEIPNSFENLCKLMFLDLSWNLVSGRASEIFQSLSRCTSSQLESISLSNSISGPIPKSIQNLSLLKILDISNNSMKGDVTEVHFTNLSRLQELFANENSLTLKTCREWLPPFQLHVLFLDSWNLGPELPSWLQRQKYLEQLSISNTGISGTIPIWFWNFSYLGLSFVDLSGNQLYGQVPRIVTAPSAVIDLSSNKFTGSLPLVSATVAVLDLSNSSFSGSIFHFFCDRMDESKQMTSLYLRNNHLTGEIPECWMNWKNLIVINLDNNHLTGNIPSTIGDLIFLQSLQLRNNHLSGEVSLSLQKCRNLIVVDLGENDFVGSIPTWIGKSLSQLMVLVLRSNKLHGDIPRELCRLVKVQILDLANNDLVGAVPTCFSNFKAMTNVSERSYTMSNSFFRLHGTYLDNVILMRKFNPAFGVGRFGVTALDLSLNNISGEIPEELTSLVNLQLLDLSNNLLTGRIPSKMGGMEGLEYLDMSKNQLSGGIPLSMSNLTFLNHFNVAYNNLTGPIPKSTQLQSFDASSFIGTKLCGPPLRENCSTDAEKPGGSRT